MSKRKQKQSAEDIFSESVDNEFAFIAGYTPGGFPYGTTWEELGIDSALPLDEKAKRYEKKADTSANPEKAINDFDLPF